MRSISRSDFFRLAAGGALGALVVLQAACGGGDDGDDGTPTPDGPNGSDGPAADAPTTGDGPPAVDAPPAIDAPPSASCENGTNVTIGGNHGHTLVVSAADVQAGQPRTYDISGAAGHAHSVTLTAAHFTMLSQNQSVTVSSTAGSAHTHQVTVVCA